VFGVRNDLAIECERKNVEFSSLPHFISREVTKKGIGTEKAINTMTETKAAPIPEEFQLMDRYWKASNYLAVGQVRSCFFATACLKK
jgi:hypothetical protein